ncbi:MAG: DUF3006 domain-containing protein [Clostridiaceae bacterium]|nr:DUF3006 domain-containing protein [Clostridiaceae bacterium]
MCNRYIVERIEGKVAILENKSGEISESPLSALPEGVFEGCLLVFKDGVFTIDMEATEARKKLIEEKLRRLLNREDR